MKEIDQIYNEYNIDNSDKNIDSDIEKLKLEKSNLESEISKLAEEDNKNKSELELNNSSYTETIENNIKIRNEIDDLCSQIALETNSSNNLSRKIQDIDNDLSNERAGIDNSEYDSISREIETENKRIFETGEQIKRRREEAKKLKRELVLLDDSLVSYKMRDGLYGKVVEKYTTHYYSKIMYKPDKTPKLVVLTAKIECGINKTSENWARRENNLKRNRIKNGLPRHRNALHCSPLRI